MFTEPDAMPAQSGAGTRPAPTAALTALQDEIWAALTALAPELKGAQDFGRLALAPESLAQVQAQAVNDDRRRTLLGQATASLQALAEDGYPMVASLGVSPAVYADLVANLEGLQAALARIEEKPPEVPAVEPTD